MMKSFTLLLCSVLTLSATAPVYGSLPNQEVPNSQTSSHPPVGFSQYSDASDPYSQASAASQTPETNTADLSFLSEHSPALYRRIWTLCVSPSGVRDEHNLRLIVASTPRVVAGISSQEEEAFFGDLEVLLTDSAVAGIIFGRLASMDAQTRRTLVHSTACFMEGMEEMSSLPVFNQFAIIPLSDHASFLEKAKGKSGSEKLRYLNLRVLADYAYTISEPGRNPFSGMPFSRYPS